MGKPDDIAEDVRDAATLAADAILQAAGSGLRYYDLNGTREKIIAASARAIMAERMAERERAAESLVELVERRRAEKRNRGNDYILSCASYIRNPIREGHQ